MSLRTTQPELALIDDLIVITQRVEKEWRCLFATIQENNRPTVIETVVVEGNGALEELLQSKKPTTVYSILPGSSTVCRTTTLPDVDNDQILEALRLQAESKFLGGTPEHRRAIAALDNSVGETNRIGLIVAWPESSNLEIPPCLYDAFFIPDVGAIAALLDGLRPTEPVLYADPNNGTVTIALSHANGAALRATKEDCSSNSSFVEGISRVVRETATKHNHSPAFTDSLIESLQTTLSHQSFDAPILLLPDLVIEDAIKRVRGVPSDDRAWWSTWGITVGGLLATTGSLQTLTSMKRKAPELHPSTIERIIQRCDNTSVAMKLTIAAILLLAFGPAILSGITLTLLDVLNPELTSQYNTVVEARKQQIVYKELGKSAWPMTKIAADVINNVPIGIDIDRVNISVGEPISIRGRAINTDGKSAAELIAFMQENLQETGMFKDIQFSYDPAGTYGDREFDLWATVVNPLKRPRYATERDFGRWTNAMRQAGIQPDEETDFIEVGVPPSSTDDGSPLSEANQESQGSVPETPAFIGDHVDRTSRDRPNRTSDGDGPGKFSDNPNQGSGGGLRIPEPLDPALIALMSESEARVALTDVTEGLQHISRGDDESKQRLRNEMRLLLDRLKETQK